MPELLEVEGLRLSISGKEILRGVSFSLSKGGSLGLVGESGSGKTLTALALMGLLPPGARITGGSVRFEGRELLGLSPEELRRLRGAGLAMVFQEPFTCLNPVRRVEDQVAEALRAHGRAGPAEALAAARRWLVRTGIPEDRGRQYPHQWSGGMRQRAMIAMAVACEPRLLIADEPTTALDVTVQAQILELLKELQRELGLALLMISHDLGVVYAMSERVAVMREGEVVEEGPRGQLFSNPRHEYTRSLMRSYLLWAGAPT